MALKITRFLGPRLVLILLACCLLARYFLILPLPRQHQPQYQARSPAGNATLGFGAIFALTIYDTTWRIQGLRAAAKLTGLQIRIPVQKRPSDEDAYAYLAGDESAEPLNEVKAMLNYLSLFDAFLATGHETALFIEDDADFSVDIRAHMDAISSIMVGDSLHHDTPDHVDGHICSPSTTLSLRPGSVGMYSGSVMPALKFQRIQCLSVTTTLLLSLGIICSRISTITMRKLERKGRWIRRL